MTRAPRPRVFALPPGVDFGAALLAGLDRRLADRDPMVAAEATLILNTERSRRRLSALIDAGPVRLGPRLRTLTDFGRDRAVDPPLSRQLLLTQLIDSLIEREPDLGPRSGAFALAGSLEELLSELEEEGVPLDSLERVDASDLAGHWQRSLRFLRLLREVGAAGGAGAARRAALLLEAARLTAALPRHPVVVAGSTGSRGATPQLMAAVAALPEGAVVLPGVDPHLPPEVWDRLTEPDARPDHPQWSIARICARLGVRPDRLPLWQEVAPPCPPRARLLSLALRPAPVTDAWRQEGPALAPDLLNATRDLTLVEAPTPRLEALAIARCLQESAVSGKRAALITADRTLARRVAGELERFGIAPDDSAGRPLGLTPPGVFLRLVLALEENRTPPAHLAALLRHPLTASGPVRAAHLRLTRGFEHDILRSAQVPSAAAVTAWAGDDAERAPWARWLAEIVASPVPADAAPFEAHLSHHLEMAERIAAGPELPGPDAAAAPPRDDPPASAPDSVSQPFGRPAGTLWDAAAGQAAARRMQEIADAAHIGGPMRRAGYKAAMSALLMEVDVPEAAYTPDPRVAIWGTIEARVERADLTILGGLTEGVWPKQPSPDPWLSTSLRAAIGLPPTDRQIGLAAHDVEQAIGAPEVILTRSLRDSDAPTVASRWLLRLENLCRGLGAEGEAAWSAMRLRGAACLRRADALDQPLARVPAAPRPAPVPPAAARPRQLSVTDLETLVRDPYAVYAKRVLGLRPLEPLHGRLDARHRGEAFHRVLEHAVREINPTAPDLLEAFRSLVDTVLRRTVPSPAARAVWSAQLLALAPAFFAAEAARQDKARPKGFEIPGEMVLAEPPMTLRARADRIDLSPEGQIVIYDYKSTLPTPKQLAVFKRQLELEAMIAEAGGFEGVSKAAVLDLAYVGLGSSAPVRQIPDVPSAIVAARRDATRLIAAYLTPSQAFRARTRPERIEYAGLYDALARFGEWQESDPTAPVHVP
ncbi:MAG: double-strand break repair protein AddB [Pseudomonadota bacterium]